MVEKGTGKLSSRMKKGQKKKPGCSASGLEGYG